MARDMLKEAQHRLMAHGEEELHTAREAEA